MADTSAENGTFKAPFRPSSNVKLNPDITSNSSDDKEKDVPHSQEKIALKNQVNVPLPYEEPEWGGPPPSSYNFEIIKSGTYVSTLPITTSFLVFGRLDVCDVKFEHPSVSRYHAIVQYCKGDDNHQKGFYLYDLGSTHGTFLNKDQIKSKIYYKLKVGYVLKFGGSSRLHIFQGPDDVEEEIVDKKPVENNVELAGCDWGMGDDAAEEEDSENSINPFALSTPNEDLYLDDPKKTLRGWFEREGYELEYDVQEKGFRTFSCTVRLPIDTPTGDFLPVEASVSGKKKEAVIACALEACRTLDRLGLLRQSHQESRQRKRKKWEENDFYDSDEDTFYDRTGEIEKRREMRKRLSKKVEVENFQSINAKLGVLNAEIDEAKKKLSMFTTNKSKSEDVCEADSLEAYMSNLKDSSRVPTDKFEKRKLMLRLAEAEKEKAHLEKLLNIARPAKLPTVQKHPSMVGKRLKSRLNFSTKSNTVAKLKPNESISCDKEENTEEVESDSNNSEGENTMNSLDKEKMLIDSFETNDNSKKYGLTLPIERSDCNSNNGNKVKQANEPTTEKVKKNNKNLNETAISGPSKPKHFQESCSRPELQCENIDSTSSDTNVCLNLKTDATEKSDDVEVSKSPFHVSSSKNSKKSSCKRNKIEIDVYKTDSADYTTWVPPPGQTGDGMTHLNAKYGY